MSKLAGVRCTNRANSANLKVKLCEPNQLLSPRAWLPKRFRYVEQHRLELLKRNV
jgi:hypothetical protein